MNRGGRAPTAEGGASLLDLRLLGRHQASAAIATAVDFGAMVALVELVRVSPPFATLLSALCGGVTNFLLSRAWAFRSIHRGSTSAQAMRYAMVCAGGALLNASILRAVLAIGDVSYVAARIAISVLVSVAYTYPLHTQFVFRATGRGEASEPSP